MTITHETDRNMFVARNDEGEHMGEIEYERGGDGRLLATHTRVDDAYQGHGVGGSLLDELACHAEQSGLKVVPICAFVAAEFKRHPEKYRNIIAEE